MLRKQIIIVFTTIPRLVAGLVFFPFFFFVVSHLPIGPIKIAVVTRGVTSLPRIRSRPMHLHLSAFPDLAADHRDWMKPFDRAVPRPHRCVHLFILTACVDGKFSFKAARVTASFYFPPFFFHCLVIGRSARNCQLNYARRTEISRNRQLAETSQSITRTVIPYPMIEHDHQINRWLHFSKVLRLKISRISRSFCSSKCSNAKQGSDR